MLLEKMTPHELILIAPASRQTSANSLESVLSYKSDIIKQIVWEIKYHQNKNLADIVSVCMHDVILEHVSERTLFYNAQKPLLVPIPMSRVRRKKYGFNQARLLAECLYRQDSGFYKGVADILRHARNGASQTTLRTKQARQKNMHERFYVSQSQGVRGENVIIIDDVTTTGATIREARRALREAGAKHIHAITIAH